MAVTQATRGATTAAVQVDGLHQPAHAQRGLELVDRVLWLLLEEVLRVEELRGLATIASAGISAKHRCVHVCVFGAHGGEVVA